MVGDGQAGRFRGPGKCGQQALMDYLLGATAGHKSIRRNEFDADASRVCENCRANLLVMRLRSILLLL